MNKLKSIIPILVLLLGFFNCENSKIKTPHYEAQLGDTPFNAKLDSPSFKFCDSTQVLHKRALVSYQGGQRNLESEIIKNYNYEIAKEAFTGYFIVRFAVNCNNETGRFRIETLDSNFKETTCSDALKNHILDITKNLKGWKLAYYKDKKQDCYRFLTIKMKNGEILNS